MSTARNAKVHFVMVGGWIPLESTRTPRVEAFHVAGLSPKYSVPVPMATIIDFLHSALSQGHSVSVTMSPFHFLSKDRNVKSNPAVKRCKYIF